MSDKLLEQDTYAVVEVLGHNTFAGKVSEHVIGGSGFIRVDVPELPERRNKRRVSRYNLAKGDYDHSEVEDVIPEVPGFTKLIGAGSIYAITPCSEEVARRVAEQKRSMPVNVLDLPGQSGQRLLDAGDPEDQDDEAEEDDE